jgi:general secretion pathway protein D
LQHADAEDLAQTLSAMLSGSSGAARGAGEGAQAIRASVAGLAEGISVTADPATNSLVIQASQEGFSTLAAVIEMLDIARPQVLVEALIMEVDITDAEALGFDGLVRLIGDDYDLTIAQNSAGSDLNDGRAEPPIDGGDIPAAVATSGASLALPLLVNMFSDSRDDGTGTGTVINGIIQAASRNAGVNIISAPHILTSDNEEAEIRVGDNIPIISSRIQAAGGITTVPGVDSSLATSVNVERQDIGVTLRVTPQITEGNTLRMEIYQEITSLNEALQEGVGNVDDVGPALSNRRIENTVVVADGETIVIGGLIGEKYSDTVNKVPWLGDIPFLGWAFKSTTRALTKTNLLVFLTPHIIRSKEDLEYQTIRKRDQFVSRTQRALALSEREQAVERAEMKAALAAGEPYNPGRGLNPVRHAILAHESRYPDTRMEEIEAARRAALEAAATEPAGPSYYLQAGLYGDESQAVEVLTDLIDLGFDGSLIADERGGALLYEVRVGPYESLSDARTAEVVLERSQGLNPAILLEEASP